MANMTFQCAKCHKTYDVEYLVVVEDFQAICTTCNGTGEAVPLANVPEEEDDGEGICCGERTYGGGKCRHCITGLR